MDMVFTVIYSPQNVCTSLLTDNTWGTHGPGPALAAESTQPSIGKWKCSVASAQFGCEPNSALKYKVRAKKRWEKAKQTPTPPIQKTHSEVHGRSLPQPETISMTQ